MKSVFLAVATFLLSSSAFAAADSVGVFHRADKVIVLINEHTPGRLQEFMNALGAQQDMLLVNHDQGIKIQCSRDTRKAVCTFRFLPSEQVAIGTRNVQALVNLADMGVATATSFTMTFESSREDIFTLKIEQGQIVFYGSKRG